MFVDMNTLDHIRYTNLGKMGVGSGWRLQGLRQDL